MYRIMIIVILLMVGFSAEAQKSKIGIALDIHRQGSALSTQAIEKDFNWTWGYWEAFSGANFSYQRFVSDRLALKPQIGYMSSGLIWMEREDNITIREDNTRINYLSLSMMSNYYFGKKQRGFQFAIGPTFYKFLRQKNYTYKRPILNSNDPFGGYMFGTLELGPDVEGLSDLAVFLISELTYAIPLSFNVIDHGEFVIGMISSFQVKGIVEADNTNIFYLTGLKLGLNYYLYTKEERKALLE